MNDEKSGSGVADRFATIMELVRMLREHRRLWMIPCLLLLMLIGFALMGLQAIPYVAPFIYAVF